LPKIRIRQPQVDSGSITASLETAVFEELVVGRGRALRIVLNQHAEITLSESEFNQFAF
jgi:hypothetical protein